MVRRSAPELVSAQRSPAGPGPSASPAPLSLDPVRTRSAMAGFFFCTGLPGWAMGVVGAAVSPTAVIPASPKCLRTARSAGHPAAGGVAPVPRTRKLAVQKHALGPACDPARMHTRHWVTGRSAVGKHFPPEDQVCATPSVSGFVWCKEGKAGSALPSLHHPLCGWSPALRAPGPRADARALSTREPVARKRVAHPNGRGALVGPSGPESQSNSGFCSRAISRPRPSAGVMSPCSTARTLLEIGSSMP